MRVSPSDLRASSEPTVDVGIFWRCHWSDLPPFSVENAWSRPWGEDDAVPIRGYSAVESAEALVHYMEIHGSGIGDDDPIVIFEGAVVGTGPDLEPLVIPRRAIAWVRGRDLDDGILEFEDDPVRLAEILSRLGSARRLK